MMIVLKIIDFLPSGEDVKLHRINSRDELTKSCIDFKMCRIPLRYRVQVVRQLGIFSCKKKEGLLIRTKRIRGLGCDSVRSSFIGIMNQKTMTNATDGTQANAEQSLTSPVVTSTFSTPTMTFGEVGKTGEQETSSYAARAHGVGHFESNKLLERQVLIDTYQWAVSDSGALVNVDIDTALKQYARNHEVLRQFAYYRPNQIEITVRLNTNQFYVGSLLVSLFPGNSTGNWVDELAVLDPMVISASSAEATVKTYSYSYPDAWLKVDGTYPVSLVIYILNALKQQTDSLPDSITVSLWARYKDIELSYPHIEPSPEAQSGVLPIKRPVKEGSQHPADDPGAHAGHNPAKELVDSLVSVPVDIMGEALKPISDIVGAGMGLLSILDKPDKTDAQTTVNIEGSTDMFATDIPDSNVTVGMYKDRYLDPTPSRLPMGGNWTVSEYAQIPGLKALLSFNPGSTSSNFYVLGQLVSETTLRTPLDYAYVNTRFWRGSIKVMLQFFASSFTSARFALEYRNAADASFDTSYDNGLSRVIDVKGDTVELITLPYLDDKWWSESDLKQCRLRLVSTIASTDPSTDPIIYCNVWVAGGPDIQFAWPILAPSGYWPYRAPPSSKKKKDSVSLRGKKKPIAQAAIGKMFLTSFPPISENCVYDYDQGLCSNEALGAITDVCKRYCPLLNINNYDGTFFHSSVLDAEIAVPGANSVYANWVVFRNSFFGAWRAAFLFRSGGYRFRRMPSPGQKMWRIWAPAGSLKVTAGTTYVEPHDGVVRLTVPQVMDSPFGMLGGGNLGLDIQRQDSNADYLSYIAARDDVQFGYPILPSGIPLPSP